MSKSQGLPLLKTTRKRGDERFVLGNQILSMTVLDFWQWAASDLIGNTSRGVLAEFIVAKALGLTTDVRVDWLAFDLETKEGLKIEVKSSSYLQSWHQSKISRINFSICPARSWNPATNTITCEPKRHADLYIFCLIKHMEKESLNPLNLDYWEFYILPSSKLNDLSQTQKTISLSRLMKLNPRVAKFPEVAASVKSLSNEMQIQKL